MSETPAEPRISEDGRFYWDGHRWAPVPAASGAPAASGPGPKRIPGAIVCAGGLLVLVAPTLPWLTASAPFVGTISVNLLNGDGLFILALGAIASLCGLAMLVRGPQPLPVVVALVAFLAAIGVTILDFADIQQRIANAASGEIKIFAQTGPGPYVSWLGSVVGLVGVVMAFVARSSPAEFPPESAPEIEEAPS